MLSVWNAREGWERIIFSFLFFGISGAYDILSILGCVRWKNLNGNPLSFSSNIELKSVNSKSEQSNVGSSASGEGDIPADFAGDKRCNRCAEWFCTSLQGIFEYNKGELWQSILGIRIIDGVLLIVHIWKSFATSLWLLCECSASYSQIFGENTHADFLSRCIRNARTTFFGHWLRASIGVAETQRHTDTAIK